MASRSFFAAPLLAALLAGCPALKSSTDDAGTHDARQPAADAGPACLDGSAFGDLFTITDPSFCAVATYEANEALPFAEPSWGHHGGPLLLRVEADGGLTLVRWSAPAGKATGALTKTETSLTPAAPVTAEYTSQAVDLPFFHWTAVAWWFGTGSGEIDQVVDGGIAHSSLVNSPVALVGMADGGAGRLYYLGSARVGSTERGTSGLYTADVCSTVGAPALGDGGNCAAPQLLDAWMSETQTLTTDLAGNLFATASTPGQGQEARGYPASKLGPGAPSFAGTPLFATTGYGLSLAALAPQGSWPGVLALQPYDDGSSTPEDVLAQRYLSDGGIAPSGAPTKLLALAASKPALSLMTDPQRRLWVSAAGASTTRYVVLVQTAP